MGASARAQQAPGCGAPGTDWIAGCTAIIDNPSASAQEHAKALRFRGIAQYKHGAYDEAIADFTAVIALKSETSRPMSTAPVLTEASGTMPAPWPTTIVRPPSIRSSPRSSSNAASPIIGCTTSSMRVRITTRRSACSPTVATFFRRRGDLRRDQGDLAGAGADFEAALRLNPKDVFAYLARGDLAAAQHDYDKAFADYDKALAVKPDLPQVASLIYSARSMAAVDMGDVKRALDDYDALLKIEPDNALYLQGRAFTAFAAGDFAAAAAGFGSAVQKRPGLSYSVIMRYVARSRLGEHDTPELRRNAEALDRNAWPWPLIGLFLGEMTPDEVRASMVQAIGEGAERRKCEATFFLAEYELLHRRRDEAVTMMQEAAKSCSSDALERNAAVGEAKRLTP